MNDGPIVCNTGILVAAKKAGFIPVVQPLLERMRAQGYRLSQRLIDRALVEAGENPQGS